MMISEMGEYTAKASGSLILVEAPIILMQAKYLHISHVDKVQTMTKLRVTKCPSKTKCL